MMSISYYEKTFYASFRCYKPLDAYLASEPYVVEGVWQKIDVEVMNVVLVNGEKRI